MTGKTEVQTKLCRPMIGGVRYGLAGLILAIAVLLSFGPAKADEISRLRSEVDQLKQQVLFLQNQMPQAGMAQGGATGGAGTLAADQEVRFQQIERLMSDLTGQIEQLELKLNDLAQKIDLMQKDTEFRLSRLEQGGAGALPPAGVAATTGSTPPPPAEGGPAPLSPEAQQPAALPPPTQPGVLGTLSQDQMQNLPQPPSGAAEQAAASASGAPVSDGGVVLPGDTPEQQYAYATGLLQRGAYAEAELALKAFVGQHPKDTLAGNAQYWLGETYYVRSDFKNAAIAFAEGYQKYPKSAKAADNLLKLGMSLGQTGRTQDACTALRQLGKQFPDASQAIADRAQRAKQRYGCQ